MALINSVNFSIVINSFNGGVQFGCVALGVMIVAFVIGMISVSFKELVFVFLLSQNQITIADAGYFETCEHPDGLVPEMDNMWEVEIVFDYGNAGENDATVMEGDYYPFYGQSINVDVDTCIELGLELDRLCQVKPSIDTMIEPVKMSMDDMAYTLGGALFIFIGPTMLFTYCVYMGY